MEMGGIYDLAEVAPPEEVDRLYAILIKEGAPAFEDEFKKVCPDVELSWPDPNRDGVHYIYQWRMERGMYLRAEADRREEEARRQSEEK
jgi:hypothetical protein